LRNGSGGKAGDAFTEGDEENEGEENAGTAEGAERGWGGFWVRGVVIADFGNAEDPGCRRAASVTLSATFVCAFLCFICVSR
jgi:hypothetical protein